MHAYARLCTHARIYSDNVNVLCCVDVGVYVSRSVPHHVTYVWLGVCGGGVWRVRVGIVESIDEMPMSLTFIGVIFMYLVNR